MKDLFVLGDSISIHYGPYLERFLEGAFRYNRKGGRDDAPVELDVMSSSNGGDSGHCLAYLMRNPGLRCDLLLLNCGLHDIKTTDTRQVSPEEYEQNLRAMLSLMAGRADAIVWVHTTPVNDALHNERSTAFKRYNRDVVLYNAIAEKVMAEHHIPVIDLYHFTASLGGGELYEDHVHFVDEVRKLQAAYIAGHLLALHR
ncbi:MAG: SGNH/GDSL hydrolase family protein [Firmicutes bacterium]|nr:SGNH/GDSL hydrolase family protein [Bacillota bacterium]